MPTVLTDHGWNCNSTKSPQIDLETTQDLKGSTEEFR